MTPAGYPSADSSAARPDTPDAARPGLLRAAVAPVGVAALAAATTAVVGLVDPNAPGHYPTCPVLFLTGLYCPGCGSLRALHALAHLDVGTAVDRNVLLVAALPFLIAAWVGWLGRRLSGRPRRVLPAAVVHAVLVLVVGYGVLRNVPAAHWLAP